MQHDITLQCKVKDWVMEKVFFPLGERVAFWLSWVLGTPTKTAFPVNEGTLCRKGDRMTKKQKIFVEEYLIDLNATQAAIRAGYSPATARIIAAENLSKPNISAAVEKALAERSKRTGINADRVVKELARIAFVKITDVVDPYDVTIKADASEDDLAAVQSVKVKTMDGDKGSSEEREVKLNDKIRALELLGKHLGMWDDRLNVEMDGDININVNYGDDGDTEQGEQE